MNHRTLHESSLSIAGAILLGSFVIAGSIMWSSQAGNQVAAAPSFGAQPQQQQGGQPSPVAAPTDFTKLKTAGEPFIGSAGAPVTIAYWYDYQCPFCKQNEETAMPSIVKDYVQAGKVKVIFKDFSFLGADSDKLAAMSHAVWEAAPDKFYAWHKAIFDQQGRENSGWATDTFINQVNTSVLGATLAKKVSSLATANAAKYKSEADSDRVEGSQFGVSGTPAFVIGSGSSAKVVVGAQPYEQIKQVIDSIK